MRIPEQKWTVLYYGDGYDVLQNGEKFGARRDEDYEKIFEVKPEIAMSYLIDELLTTKRKLDDAYQKLLRIQTILDTDYSED